MVANEALSFPSDGRSGLRIEQVLERQLCQKSRILSVNQVTAGPVFYKFADRAHIKAYRRQTERHRLLHSRRNALRVRLGGHPEYVKALHQFIDPFAWIAHHQVSSKLQAERARQLHEVLHIRAMIVVHRAKYDKPGATDGFA